MSRSGDSLKTGNLRRKYNMKKKKSVKSRKKVGRRKKRRTSAKPVRRGRVTRLFPRPTK